MSLEFNDAIAIAGPLYNIVTVIKLSIRCAENLECMGLSLMFWFKIMMEIDHSGEVSLFKRLILKWTLKPQERWK
jgi:hypothetical protein